MTDTQKDKSGAESDKEECLDKKQDQDSDQEVSERLGISNRLRNYIIAAVAMAAVAAFFVAYWLADTDEDAVSGWQAPKEVILADGQKAMLRSDSSGAPEFLTGTIDTPIADTRQAAAMAFFDQNKELYQMENPAQELVASGEFTDEIGMSHVSMEQVYQGIPVFGHGMVVHFSAAGQISTVNGEYQPDIDVSVEAQVSSEEAVTRAREDLAVKSAQISPAKPPRLVIYVLEGGEAALVWEIHIGSLNPMVQMLYFIDAHNGSVFAKYDEIIE